jgi:hypothetical protein
VSQHIADRRRALSVRTIFWPIGDDPVVETQRASFNKRPDRYRGQTFCH